jgi:hypothetical protein
LNSIQSPFYSLQFPSIPFNSLQFPSVSFNFPFQARGLADGEDHPALAERPYWEGGGWEQQMGLVASDRAEGLELSLVKNQGGTRGGALVAVSGNSPEEEELVNLIQGMSQKVPQP